MIKGFRGTDGDIEPMPFECEVFGYPNKTTDGKIMHTNTHFLTEEKAWNSLLDGWEAGVHIYTRLVEQAKIDLQKYEAQLKDKIDKRAIVRDKHTAWLHRKPIFSPSASSKERE